MNRRNFTWQFGLASSLTPMFSQSLLYNSANMIYQQEDPKSIIGQYGEWAANLLSDPAELSWRQDKFDDLDYWKNLASTKTWDYLGAPPLPSQPEIQYGRSIVFDGIKIQGLSWQLPYGPVTEAVLLQPAHGSGPWPGILGLHDHGGNKYLGWSKIVQTESQEASYLKDHRNQYYGGFAWANELAKQGFAVLVHDTFTFGSRRVDTKNVAGITWGGAYLGPEGGENQVDKSKNMEAYNDWASAHEHIMSKSLFCAGTTWPATFLREDQVALGILAAFPQVDAEKLGCCGLSGGGLRSVYLGGLDQRVKCAIPVGFMSTWRDFLLRKAYTHTWMLYIPLLPRYLDFPEILGLRAPLATLVLNNEEDQLFSAEEMHRANQILIDHFSKAAASERYSGKFYPGPHKFDRQMQKDAFAWFNKWLYT